MCFILFRFESQAEGRYKRQSPNGWSLKPFYWWITFYFVGWTSFSTTDPLNNVMVTSRAWLRIMLLQTFMGRFLWEHLFLNQLCKSVRVIIEWYSKTLFNFLRIPDCLPEWLYHFVSRPLVDFPLFLILTNICYCQVFKLILLKYVYIW